MEDLATLVQVLAYIKPFTDIEDRVILRYQFEDLETRFSKCKGYGLALEPFIVWMTLR